MITNENSAVIIKDAAGNVTFQETEDLSGLQGAKNGIILGATLGMLTPNTSMWTMMGKGALWLGFGGRLHDAGLRGQSDPDGGGQMPPNSSALIALVTHQWADDLVRFLGETANKVGWMVITERDGQGRWMKAKVEAAAMDAAEARQAPWRVTLRSPHTCGFASVFCSRARCHGSATELLTTAIRVWRVVKRAFLMAW